MGGLFRPVQTNNGYIWTALKKPYSKDIDKRKLLEANHMFMFLVIEAPFFWNQLFSSRLIQVPTPFLTRWPRLWYPGLRGLP